MQASRFKSTGKFRFGQMPPPMPSSIEDDNDTQTQCDFCDRPSGNVFCRACGHIFRGRIRGRCPRHPELILLMDYEVCTECHSSVLKEYGTGPTGEGGSRASSTSVTTSLPTTTQPFTPGAAPPGAQGRRERRVIHKHLPSGTALSRSKGIRP